ncbi:MAG: hypothetical protein ACREQ9_20235, partial [Candidatus Binatia bacterium]
RAAWAALRLWRPPWEAAVRRAELLGHLWRLELAEEIPAVHREPWREIRPSRSRALFMRLEHPVSIRESRAVPAPWRQAGPIKQLELAAGAALDAIDRLRPRLHRSLVVGRLVEASGTTVLVTALAEDEDVMAVPWSAGEPWRAVSRRIARGRKRWTSPIAHELWRAALRQWARPVLPPPQAVVSVVGNLGIENPETAPMASGGASPLAIVVGRASVSVAWDHRVYDAVDAARFYEEFFPAE